MLVRTLALGVLGALASASIAAAVPPQPTVATANVDGNPSEWNLTTDFFSDMLRAGGNGGQTKVESKLYLRYSCSQQVLYAYVAAQPGVTIAATLPDDQFIKIGGPKYVDANSGDNGTAPDFAYVGLSGATATGWEASASIAPGSYTLNVHAQVNDGGLQTSAVPGRSIALVIACDEQPEPLPLVVSKTADTSYQRAFDWTVAKSAAPATVTTTENTATFSYTVTVTKSAPIDSNFAVTGQITVQNPNDYEATGVTVTDAIVGGPTCAVTGGSGVSVPAGGSVVLPYTCVLTSATNGTNQAVATWSAGASAGEAAVVFGAPSETLNATVDVTDAFGQEAAALLQGGDDLAASAVFTYTRTVPVPASGCSITPNVAMITSPHELIKTASAQVEACRTVPPPNPPNPPVTPPTPPTPPVIVVSGGELPPASLAVVKRGPKQARAGQILTFTIKVTNTSATASATSVVLSDVLPAGYAFASKPSGTTLVKGKLTWNLGTLAPGESRTVRVKIRADRNISGTRCNTAVASAGNAPSQSAKACTKILRIAGVVRVPIVTG